MVRQVNVYKNSMGDLSYGAGGTVYPFFDRRVDAERVRQICADHTHYSGSQYNETHGSLFLKITLKDTNNG